MIGAVELFSDSSNEDFLIPLIDGDLIKFDKEHGFIEVSP